MTSCIRLFQRKRHTEPEKQPKKPTVDPDIIKLKQDVNQLVLLVESIIKNEAMKTKKFDENFKELSQKISNLERNALIVSDF